MSFSALELAAYGLCLSLMSVIVGCKSHLITPNDHYYRTKVLPGILYCTTEFLGILIMRNVIYSNTINEKIFVVASGIITMLTGGFGIALRLL